MKKKKHWAEIAADEINSLQIQHHTYRITRERLLAETLVRKGGECIALIGPSRIGKTSLVRELEVMVNPSDPAELLDRRPVVRLTCRNRGDRGLFTTKAFYLDALATIQHPIFSIHGKDLSTNVDAVRQHDRETNPTLGSALEGALTVLETKYLIIDETQHLQHMMGGIKSSLQMMEYFKTMAERLDIVLIFVGAYPIVNVLELSPHLLGRLGTIEMKRYTIDCEDSLVHFQQVLNWFSGRVKFEKGVNGFGDWNEELFNGSLGVIGLLSAWIRDGLAEMMANGDTKLSLEHMRVARKAYRFHEQMLREIEDGELYMGSAADDESLSFKKPVSQMKSAQRKKRACTRPFQTKVKRRPAGGRK